ncbi:uncharacterized protein TRAVEDRAFT_17848 [Trametes versicolor FP-101664 SS1]|uniref:uncharacterized protein n=1 Tax=Trametes versicolor (strain FP-101664) TaxID=717944 RepID=UPI0004621FEB|nr:uncharacterized protein TRAVEDRAFT_17848 [Trametes versicolor FP-101664 SS1]EIW63542.1 hypothetical protein TRAVEDRAFT_17848 [Trametes versicolor FP-101664 SS1]
MTPFWKGWQAWLAVRGFTLNLRPVSTDPPSKAVSWYIPQSTSPASESLPYAYCVREGESSRVWDDFPISKIGWAQDSEHRPIAFKLTCTGSDEYRIYQRLLNLADSLSPTECCGVLRPVAILDTGRPFSFVAMPRWGHVGTVIKLRTVGEAMQFMRCTSQDITEWNMLMNCYNPYSPKNARDLLYGHRSPSDVHYCIYDFDISRIFPPNAPLNACRRPASDSYEGAPPYHPLDASCGEYYYDPFAFDVGCLGNLYRTFFSTMVPLIPLLAPLFDKMTTHRVADRFTAAQAAEFIESAFAELPESALMTPVSLKTEWECVDDSDNYWTRTTVEFRKQWAHFRVPSLPWTSKLLMQFASSDMGWSVLCFIRRTLCV